VTGARDDARGVDVIRDLGARFSNWGRWGDDDQRGTLNHVRAEDVAAASASVRDGTVISMAVPYDEDGPQSGLLRRFNPIHVMLRDGADVAAGTAGRDFFGGDARHFAAADDLIIMPLQCGTQWDALAHVMFDGSMYNGFPVTDVTSGGARTNDVRNASDAMTGRGVLLDVARWAGVPWLEPGHAISAADLDACAAAQGTSVRRGDHVFVRTGRLHQVRVAGSWSDYCGGPAPGLGLASIAWIAEREVAAVATDTWGFEVRPSELSDVYQPLHLVLIVYLGLWIGEIFDLEDLASRCASDGRYEFLFCGPPLPFTGAVGSPLNPIAVR
jgi:kynurenine formamidase